MKPEPGGGQGLHFNGCGFYLGQAEVAKSVLKQKTPFFIISYTPTMAWQGDTRLFPSIVWWGDEDEQ